MTHVHQTVRRVTAGAALLAIVLLGASCASDPESGGAGSAAEPSVSHPVGHASHPDIPPAAPLRAGERFVNLSLPEPYRPAAPNGGTDEYRCFLVDPRLTERAFLTGSQFLPQNADLVHHAIVFRLEPSEVEAARELDTTTPGAGWRCFGNAGIGDAAWVAHWAPGANETLLDANLGYDMPAGSQLVLQVHYNLLATGNRPDQTDQSGIRLRLADGRTSVAPLVTELLPAPVELPCAPDESGPLCDRRTAIRDVVQRFGQAAAEQIDQLVAHCTRGRDPVPSDTQHCDHPVTRAGTVHALAGHMHLLGRAIKVELNPGTPTARTLLDIPAYDFDAQAIRPLPAPVTVAPGDTYRVTCTHDVTLRQRLPQLRSLPARYVVWGEGTSDEMCLGLVIVSRPA